MERDRAPKGRAETVAVRFRREIAEAEAGGTDPSLLTLKLTLSDASKLMRDPEVPVADISFVGGVMSYLGVAVARGGVAKSALCSEAGAG